jgi:hypothetical protein
MVNIDIVFKIGIKILIYNKKIIIINMKYLKKYHNFLNEDVAVNTETNLDSVQVVKTLNTKERIIKSITVLKKDPSTLSERGPELINQAVMKKGENPDSLNLAIDSEKLEYAWRMIAKDVDAALSAGKVEKNGVVAAFNIKKTPENKVVFDFTFENKDSTQNTDPSGKTTKNILAGQYIKGEFKTNVVEIPQVWIVLQNAKADIDLKNVTNPVDFLNKKRQLLEAGYTQIAGTYNFKLPVKGEWVSYDTNDNTKVVQFFENNSGSYFDVKELYKKFGIDPNTRKSTGTPDWNIQIK